jgi:anti-sigma28 factor (negative regulator of flagellin synthesis)
MRIDNRNATSPPAPVDRPVRGPAAAQAAGAAEQADEVRLGGRQQVVENALAAYQSSHQARLERLAREVQAGAYQVDAGELSGALVNETLASGEEK